MLMSKRLPVLLVLNIVLLFASVNVALADAEDAADLYRQAQELKRDHQFDDAHVMFETVADMEDSGAWGGLAI